MIFNETISTNLDIILNKLFNNLKCVNSQTSTQLSYMMHTCHTHIIGHHFEPHQMPEEISKYSFTPLLYIAPNMNLSYV